MSRKPPSLSAILERETFSRDTVSRQTVPRGGIANPPARKAPSHVSVYINKRVQRVLKEIAIEHDCRSHDLLLQAVDMLLASYGRPSLAALEEGP